MKWFDSHKSRPRKGSYIWGWNSISQKQELFVVNPDEEWDSSRIPNFPIWAYVFESDQCQPERLNEKTPKGDVIV